MKSPLIAISGDPHIGVFSRAFEDIAIVHPEVPDEYAENLREELSVELVKTTIQGSRIVGSLCAGNSNGIVVSGMIREEELELISEHREVLQLRGGINAAGNVILANDSFAALHPDIPMSTAEDIGSLLGVPVVRTTIAGIKTVGMAACATNTGVLLHPRTTKEEMAALERICDLPLGLGTVNMGSGLVGAGLVANSKGYLAGIETSGYELGRIEEVFEFSE